MHEESQLLSVIIPTYNRAALCLRAIQSVLLQNYKEFEIIVVDDGSNADERIDGSLNGDTVLCRQAESALADLRVSYIQHERSRGVSAARNTGIEVAKGQLIAFLDSDDEWLPSKLATQKKYLADNPGIAFCHCAEIWIRNNRRVNPRLIHEKARGWAFASCLPMCRISPSAVLLYRDIFQQVGRFDEQLRVCEDYELWLRIALSHEIGYVDEALVCKYGGHADQLSSSEPAIDRFRIYSLCKLLAMGPLTAKQQRMTKRAVTEKLGILELGAIKRDNTRLVSRCRDIARSIEVDNYRVAYEEASAILSVDCVR